MNFHDIGQAYPSFRYPAYGRRGMVATSNRFAAMAGMDMLKRGGNAVDAALAAAACLTVCEPTSNGIGGDLFAIVHFEGELYGLNASGPSPELISIDRLKQAGHKEIPRYGLAPVNVPGAPAGWAALSKRFGRLPLTDVFAPAVNYAAEGYAVSNLLSRDWQRAAQVYSRYKGEEFKPWFDTFAPGGRVPMPGEIVRLPHHAETLALIAATGAEAFYSGELSEKIDAFSRQHGGCLRGEDLSRFDVEWVDPISVDYRGYEVWEIPPNGQGIVALMALNILKGFDFTEKNDVVTYHRQIEAIKLAFEDAQRYVTDPKKMKVTVEELLSDDWAAERRRRIGERALEPLPSREQDGGTVYLAAADGEGNMVSLIQSNYNGFGSGMVVPGTGIALHNRGHNFSFDPEHDNCLEPNKRPYHTIIPGFLSKDGQPVGPFGVMGGFMQPQGHVQVVMNLVDLAHNPQAALDAPRWQWMRGRKVNLENTLPAEIINGLVKRGHEVTVTKENVGYGRGQIVFRDRDVLVGATEPRIDGAVAVW